jgi:DNA-directed RNA polymerase specialized sigma24 family protein
MKRERDPTPEEFNTLLDWLDPDRERAALRYESLRRGLTRILVTRGCSDPDELTDEVLNRVAVRIEKMRTSYDSPEKCCHGFANNVAKENCRKPPDQGLDDSHDLPARIDDDDNERREREDRCLAECISELSSADSNLFRRYFQDEKKIQPRKQLASELQLTANALRIKAHRIRRRLRQCMEACLALEN